MFFTTLLRIFFDWLYHSLAFAYDLVSAVVSFGRWNRWVESVLPFLTGTRVLELGFGPGHLQLSLRQRFKEVYGVDESKQMGIMAKNRLTKAGDSAGHGLVRGLAQTLPFADNSFSCLVSSFPSEYISDHRTLLEVRRVLAPGGRLVVLPVVWPRNRLLAWFFRVTGETPDSAPDLIRERLISRFQMAGFQTEVQMIHGESGIVMILIAGAENGKPERGI